MIPQGGVFSQEPGPGVELLASPPVPALRSPWTLTILVDHPLPGEVRVLPPPFPEGLVLEQVRTGLRAFPDQEGGKRRLTAVEYILIPRRPGTITLAPFEVLVPGRRALTGELKVRVLGPGPAPPPRLRWAGIPPFLVSGQEAEISLVQEGGPPLDPPPDYPPKIPENGILEILPPAEDGDPAERPLLRFRIIPLGGPEVALPPFRFSQGGFELEIPPLKLPLRPGPPRRSPALVSPPAEGGPPAPRPPPPFPLTGEGVFLEELRALWEGGERAQALAVLRRREGGEVLGPRLRPLRRELERALGITRGEDEPWRPRRALLLALGGDLLFWGLITGGRLFRLRSRKDLKKRVTLFSSRGYTGSVVVLLGLLVPVIALLAGGRGEKPAVLREETPVYRIPDPQGTLEARLPEGRRVLIRSTAGSWVYLESPDGAAGWAPRAAAAVY